MSIEQAQKQAHQDVEKIETSGTDSGDSIVSMQEDVEDAREKFRLPEDYNAFIEAFRSGFDGNQNALKAIDIFDSVSETREGRVFDAIQRMDPKSDMYKQIAGADGKLDSLDSYLLIQDFDGGDRKVSSQSPELSAALQNNVDVRPIDYGSSRDDSVVLKGESGRNEFVVLPDGDVWSLHYDQLGKFSSASKADQAVDANGAMIENDQRVSVKYDGSGKAERLTVDTDSPDPFQRTKVEYTKSDKGSWLDEMGREAPFLLSDDGTSFGFVPISEKSSVEGDTSIIRGKPVYLTGSESPFR